MNARAVIVGIDVGGTADNVTVLTYKGTFLIDQLLEVPSRVLEGPLAVLRQAYEPGLATEGREVSSGNRPNG